jgi:hypothetical protein
VVFPPAFGFARWALSGSFKNTPDGLVVKIRGSKFVDSLWIKYVGYPIQRAALEELGSL